MSLRLEGLRLQELINDILIVFTALSNHMLKELALFSVLFLQKVRFDIRQSWIKAEVTLSPTQFRSIPVQTHIEIMLKVVLTLALIFAVESARVNFSACPNGYPTPEWVESDFCTAEKCTLTRGLVFTARVSFTPREQFSSLLVGIKATWLGLPLAIDIPAGYENACDFLEGASCPVQASTNYIWALQTPIASSYPQASGVTMQSKKFEDHQELNRF